MINPINILVHYFLLHLLCSAVQSFTVTKDGVVGKAAVLTGPAHIGVPSACFQRVDPGPCGRDIIRVFYDHKTYTCKAFSYSGCGGNMNRFVSVKNCYKLCHPYYRQRPAEIVDAGTTTPAASTEPPTSTPAASSTPPTFVVPAPMPMRPGPIRVIQVPPPQRSAPPPVEFTHLINDNRPRNTGYLPMGMMPMSNGMGYSQPFGYGYGKKK